MDESKVQASALTSVLPPQLLQNLFIRQPTQPAVEADRITPNVPPRAGIHFTEVHPVAVSSVDRERRMVIGRVKRALALAILV